MDPENQDRIRALVDEHGAGDLARLTTDVLAAREGERQQRPHACVTLGESEHRNFLPVREQQDLLHDGLRENRLVRHDPERVDLVLKLVECGRNFLRRSDLSRHELQPLVARDDLGLPYEVTGPRAVEDDADTLDLRSELLEHA